MEIECHGPTFPGHDLVPTRCGPGIGTILILRIHTMYICGNSQGFARFLAFPKRTDHLSKWAYPLLYVRSLCFGNWVGLVPTWPKWHSTFISQSHGGLQCSTLVLVQSVLLSVCTIQCPVVYCLVEDTKRSRMLTNMNEWKTLPVFPYVSVSRAYWRFDLARGKKWNEIYMSENNERVASELTILWILVRYT